MKIQDFMEITSYRISEGYEYQWKCYGPNAFVLNSFVENEYHISITFNTLDETVYEMEVINYRNNDAYRIINPAYLSSYISEANQRGVDFNQAWDDVKFTDLDSEDDFIYKALAIINNEEYDDRVTIEFECPKKVKYALMEAAHKQDKTFNQYMSDMLKEASNEIIESSDFGC